MLHTKERLAPSVNEQRITSLEIAELTGKRHTDLLRSIRNQEIAWKRITERKFAFSEYQDKSGRMNPMYNLSMLECLYIATKFKDEERAKLVLRWFELEQTQKKTHQLTESVGDYPEETVITVRMGKNSNQIYVKDGVIFAKLATLARYIGYYSTPTAYLSRWGEDNSMKVQIGKQYHWYINARAFAEMVKQKGDVPFGLIQNVYTDVFGIAKQKDDDNPYTYQFTDSEMLEIVRQINRKPVNKSKIMELLLDGKEAVEN